MSNEQTIWARHMEAMQQQEKALEDRWKRDRRERIATAAMQGLLAYQGAYLPICRGAAMAVAFADALIEALDEPEEDKT